MASLRRSLLLFIALAVGAAGWGWGKSSEVGVLIMAHGGSPLWNKTVATTVQKAGIPYPTRVFFGMAHSRDEVDKLQGDVAALESKGVHTIIVIPLLVSSYSEVYRQWRYLMGVDIQPGFNTSFFPLQKHVDIEFSDPFNDDPIIALVLLDRAREISQNPAQETVFLVAHGPNDDADNVKWTHMLRQLSATIQDRGNFKSVEGMTLRDDAPSEVRSQAVEALRSRVAAVTKAGGRSLVIPLLIAPGGIENKIGAALKGLDFTLNAKLLLPDDRISQWIRSKVP